MNNWKKFDKKSGYKILAQFLILLPILPNIVSFVVLKQLYDLLEQVYKTGIETEDLKKQIKKWWIRSCIVGIFFLIYHIIDYLILHHSPLTVQVREMLKSRNNIAYKVRVSTGWMFAFVILWDIIYISLLLLVPYFYSLSQFWKHQYLFWFMNVSSLKTCIISASMWVVIGTYSFWQSFL